MMPTARPTAPPDRRRLRVARGWPCGPVLALRSAVMAITRTAMAALTGMMVAIAPGAAHAQSFADALSAALAIHPQLAQATREREIAGTLVEAARAGYAPIISTTVQGGGKLQYEEEGNTGPGLDGRASARIDWTLYDGGETDARVARARIGTTLAEATLIQVRHDLVLDLLLRYLAVLRAQELLVVADEELALARERRDLEELRLASGGGDTLRLLVADARVQQAQTRLMQRDAELLAAVAAWRLVAAEEPDLERFARPQAGLAVLPADREQAVDEALAGHPTLAVLALQADQLALDRPIIEAGAAPTLSAYGDAILRRDTLDDEGSRGELGAGLEARYTLYEGGRRGALAREAALRADNALDALRQQRRVVQQAAETAWYGHEAARSRQALAAETLAIAEDIVDASQRTFDEGAGEREAVIEAALQRNDALTTLLTAEHDVIRLRYELLHAMGELDAALFLDSQDVTAPAPTASARGGITLVSGPGPDAPPETPVSGLDRPLAHAPARLPRKPGL